jgi:hypothetical protein
MMEEWEKIVDGEWEKIIAGDGTRLRRRRNYGR